MTIEEKAAKFDEIQKALWDAIKLGHPLQSMMAANIVRRFEIPGPDGEDPESA